MTTNEEPEVTLAQDLEDTGDERAQLRELAKSFPSTLVQRDPRGNSYVGHAMVTQKMLKILGPTSFAVIEIVRGWIPAHKDKPEQPNAVVGILASMRATVDGAFVEITEVGECDNPHVHAHDGIRLKMATSDAYKRCAMRLGLGLHLWSKDGYYLSEGLEREATPAEANAPVLSGANPGTTTNVEKLTEMEPELTEAVETIKEAFPGAETVDPDATMGDLATGTPMATLTALGGPQMARAKRALEAEGLWRPPMDSWESFSQEERVAALRIMTTTS